MISGQRESTLLQFLKPLVFEAKDLEPLPARIYEAPGVDAAERLIRAELARGPKHHSKIMVAAEKLGICPGSVQKARRRLELDRDKGVWALPK